MSTAEGTERILAFNPAPRGWWSIEPIKGTLDGKPAVWHERTAIVGWLTVEVAGHIEVRPAISQLGGRVQSVQEVYGVDFADDVLIIDHESQLRSCSCGRITALVDDAPDAWWCRECAGLIPGSPELPGLER